MQITDLAVEQKITPILRLGFRPFFLAGAIFSMLSLIIWGAILSGTITMQPFAGGLWWHMHEMLFGFGGAIVAGFLLTAVQNWTGQRGISGGLLLALFLLWLAGRLVLLFPHYLPSAAVILIDLSFLPAVAWLLARPILKVKQYRNLFFVPLLTLFTLANAAMYMASAGLAGFELLNSAFIAVMLMALLMSVMAGRVVPMFTANGTKTTKVLPLVWLEKSSAISLLVIILLLSVHPFVAITPWVLGCLFMLAGLLQAIRWLRWKPWITLAVPLLWSIHLAMFFIWTGLFSIGLSYIISVTFTSNLWHLLTIGGMGGLILAMISRVSLGHTGRMLTPPKTMSLAFTSIYLATLVRVFGPIIWPEYYLTSINISIAFWLVAFGLFVLHYGPMLFKPRVDGRPG